jgi:regulator of PEP synthase PpsR (kinase-PPPase family)
MTLPKRPVFFVSDGTGITAEMLGHSLLTQFEGFDFVQTVVPFIDTVEKAKACRDQLSAAGETAGVRPLVFATLVNSHVRDILGKADCLLLDFFDRFLDPLEAELGARSTHAIGLSHGTASSKGYQSRIEAVNFALAHDDGMSHLELDRAEVILVGVSRSGKTPTSLYLALQFGIKAANYPLIPEDFARNELPSGLSTRTGQLYGLSIAPERLAEIRNERRPGSKYADLDNCRYEVAAAEALMRRHGVPWINSTTRSIEEIATKILQEVKLTRQGF